MLVASTATSNPAGTLVTPGNYLLFFCDFEEGEGEVPRLSFEKCHVTYPVDGICYRARVSGKRSNAPKDIYLEP